MSVEPKPVHIQEVVRRWGEMIKFSHSVFALPFALLATFLAARAAFEAGDLRHRYPTLTQLFLVVVCMVAARSVAMTFNRLVDADLDARNPRTANRAIPAGRISKGQAVLFLLLAAMIFVVSCAGFWWFYSNPVPVLFALPILAYLCFYSYTKRLTRWSHFVLGSAIAFSPVAAWLAIHPVSVGWAAVVLMCAVTLWIAGFDIIYACQDIEADRVQRLHSLPSRAGPVRALWIARTAHTLAVLMLCVLMPVAGLGWLYGLGVIIVAGLLLAENRLVRPDDFSRVNLVFFTVNGIISMLLGLLGIVDCLLGLGLIVDSAS